MQIEDILLENNIDYDHIDLPTIKPLDYKGILILVKKLEN